MMERVVALPPAIGWMPILHQIVDSGALARMHVSAAALYIAIKRYVDFRTGYAEVSNDRLCKAIGVSKPTFLKARKSLTECGIISIVGKYYPTRYIVHERLVHYAADRTPVAYTTFPYVPALQIKVLEALKSLPLTAEQIGTTVTIGSVNVQIVNIIPSDHSGQLVKTLTKGAASLTEEDKILARSGSEATPFIEENS